MRFRTGLVFIAALAATLISNSRAGAQGSDAFEFVRGEWHLAGISEYQSNWPAAIGYYQKVIEDSRLLPLECREWYCGTAYYGIARCESQMGDDSSAVRLALAKAFAHHFWNFALAQTDSVMLSKCGFPWLDSCSRFWTSVSVEERPLWREQVPIVFYPAGYDSSGHWPLIIALHGGNGNYESFAQHWLGMANVLKAVIAIPAGVLRETQITNSWGSSMDTVEKSIVTLVKRFTSRHLADSAQVYLAGFSQGAQASIELTLLRPDLFRGAIAMSGFVDHPISDSILHRARDRGVRIYEITGQFEDQTFEKEIDSIHQKCTEAGISFALNISPGMIHEVPLDFHDQMLRAWSWVRPQAQAVHQREN
ncbi:MAG: alpha/beta hydrolase-fold protein [Candidatus Kapaibacterium sp.]